MTRVAALRLLDALGKLWALPVTMPGLLYGLLGLVLWRHTRVKFGYNALQFIAHPGIRCGCALTLGNVILYGRDADPDACGAYGDHRVCLGRHEQAHTYQYQAFGVLLLIIYPLLHARGAHHNPFERAAQRYGAGLGHWWPQALLDPRSSRGG